MSSNAVQIFGSSPALPSQPRRSPRRRQRNDIASNKKKTGNQTSKKKKNRKPKMKESTKGMNECELLYLKAVQDPFFFVNSPMKLPCVPAGPKVKTKRHALYATGTLSTGANGNGFLTLNPYAVVSDPAANSIDNAIFATNSNFTTTTFSGSATTGVSSFRFNTPYTTAQNPVFRVVAAGIEIWCEGAPLYVGGDMAYCQKSSLTQDWFGSPISDLSTDPMSLIGRVDQRKHRFIWRFASSAPTISVSEQQEFQSFSTSTGTYQHTMAVGITGASGSGAGLSFRWRAVSLIEVSSYNDGTRNITPPDGQFTDHGIHGFQEGNRIVEENRGAGGMDFRQILNEVQPLLADPKHTEKLVEVLGKVLRG